MILAYSGSREATGIHSNTAVNMTYDLRFQGSSEANALFSRYEIQDKPLEGGERRWLGNDIGPIGCWAPPPCSWGDAMLC